MRFNLWRYLVKGGEDSAHVWEVGGPPQVEGLHPYHQVLGMSPKVLEPHCPGVQVTRVSSGTTLWFPGQV